MGLFHSSDDPMAPKSAAPKVPESVLKKRKTLEKIKAERAEKALAIKKASKANRKAIFKKAEKYVKEYRNMEKALITSRRQAKQFGNYFVEPEPKLLFVTRYPWYQQDATAAPQDPRPAPPAPDPQRCVPQEQQGDHEHAPDCAVVRHLRRAEPQDCS